MTPGEHLKHQSENVEDEDTVMNQIANGKPTQPINRRSNSAEINGTAVIELEWRKSIGNMDIK